MFHRLEKTEGSSKLNAGLGVLHSSLQEPFTGAHHIGRNNTENCGHSLIESLVPGAGCSEFNGVRIFEFNVRLVTGQVDNAVRDNFYTICIAINQVKPNIVAVFGADYKLIRFSCVLYKIRYAIYLAIIYRNIGISCFPAPFLICNSEAGCFPACDFPQRLRCRVRLAGVECEGCAECR